MVSRNYVHLVATFILVIATIAIRIIHIEADTPSGLSFCAGLYVDEGYKTLSPRNLALYGKTHWNAADTYVGWMKASPATQWPVYGAFKSFGVNLKSARIIPIICFSLFVLLYVFLMRRKYEPKLFYLGFILFATDITFFTFSRIALFEMELTLFFYAIMLPILLFNEEKKLSIIPTVYVLIGGLIIAYTIKKSAMVYLLPILAATLITLVKDNKNITKKQIVFFASILLIPSILVSISVWPYFAARLSALSPIPYIYSVLKDDLLRTSPIIVASMLCAAHAITYQSHRYFNNLYRLSLLCLVILPPFILGFFYSPLRYHVPFLPAYILLIVEWFRTTIFDTKPKSTNYLLSCFGFLIFGLAIAHAFIAAFIAFNLFEKVQMYQIVIISTITTPILWSLRRYLFSNRSASYVVASIILFSVFFSVHYIGSFIANPSYQSNEIRAKLRNLVREDEVIAGDWAPFLTLGTPIKAIYSDGIYFNLPESLKIIKPDYYMLCETNVSLNLFDLLKNDKDIIVSDSPINLGIYNESNVFIYPLLYKKSLD